MAAIYSATTRMVFIGLLSHMTPALETMPFNQHLILCRRFGADLLSQIVVNQLIRTETKYPRYVGYR